MEELAASRALLKYIPPIVLAQKKRKTCFCNDPDGTQTRIFYDGGDFRWPDREPTLDVASYPFKEDPRGLEVCRRFEPKLINKTVVAGRFWQGGQKTQEEHPRKMGLKTWLASTPQLIACKSNRAVFNFRPANNAKEQHRRFPESTQNCQMSLSPSGV